MSMSLCLRQLITLSKPSKPTARLCSLFFIAHCVWTAGCFLLFFIVDSMFFEELFHFGFAIFASLTATRVSRCAITAIATINESTTKMKGSNSGQRAVDHLQNVKRREIVIIIAGVAIITASMGSVCVSALHLLQHTANIDEWPRTDFPFASADRFAVHYLFGCALYSLCLQRQWVSAKRALCKRVLIALRIVDDEEMVCDVVLQQNRSKTPVSVHLHVPNSKSKDNACTSPGSPAMPISPAILQSNSNSGKHNVSPSAAVPSPAIPTPSSVDTSTPIDTELALQNIDDDGHEIGRRGVAKPHRRPRAGTAEDVVRIDIDAIVHTHEHDHPTEQRLSIDPKSLKSTTQHTNAISTVPRMLTMPSLSQISEDDEDDDAECAITTVLFEFEDVLSTSLKSLFRAEGDVEAMSAIQKQLCFGGRERIEALSAFLARIERSSARTQCFVVTDLASKTVLTLLNEVHLLKFFVSPQRGREGKGRSGKLVSHVIGCDHWLSAGCEGKRHLILLKAMQSLRRRHGEILFVANDRAVAEHLREIKVCRAVLVETKGLASDKMEAIRDAYFA